MRDMNNDKDFSVSAQHDDPHARKNNFHTMGRLLLLVLLHFIVFQIFDARSSWFCLAFPLHDHLERHLQDVDNPETCGASEATVAEQQADASLMESWQLLEGRSDLAPGTYTIPLYFHVIHKDDETNPISAERLQFYMDYLNDGYQDSVVRFDHQETTYNYNTEWATGARTSSIEVDFKSQLRRGSMESLNVYVVHSLLPPPGELVLLAPWTGFSYLPNTVAAKNGPKDGVVIAEIRDDTDERRPNTLVHEVVCVHVYCELDE